MKLVYALCLGLISCAAYAQTATVEVEEEVYKLLPPNNGAGPLWSFGCTVVARLGGEVYATQMETGEGVARLSNTRWRLLHRGDTGWECLVEADDYRQREPVILAVTGTDTLNLYVNDSLMPPGTEYGPCFPHVLRITPGPGTPKLAALHPQWAEETVFTDHSYRGYAADAAARQLLLLNINAETSAEHYALLDSHGVTLAKGTISFPIRSCYPQVALKNGAAHVLAIGDIVEPVEEWRNFKFEQSGQKWDYVFRRLFFTSTPDLVSGAFSEPLEIANLDATAGHISNQDLWIAPDGSAYILYTQVEVQSAAMRDKFFPGASLVPSLHLAVVKDGAIVSKRVLLEGNDAQTPGHTRLHQTPDGRLFTLVNVNGQNGGNKLVQLYPERDAAPWIDVPFQTPFGSFVLADTRAGNAPSEFIDVFGYRGSGDTLCYGRVRVGE
ncbi:MAG: hypothetical protein HYV27_09720 [Candidatus Hydrogenedentes bacterium]|nr:hypothetical protein [Candidatus Hydrogenedentota bacterium]